ncbi:MAG: hypothetical protein F6K28_56360 [Microcoleus sp. SIO2G3]|nr:hypothetical protein [Microcoleus sp. SIO2G3]
MQTQGTGTRPCPYTAFPRRDPASRRQPAPQFTVRPNVCIRCAFYTEDIGNGIEFLVVSIDRAATVLLVVR